VAPKDNNPSSSSADFNSFGESGTDLSSTDQDYEYDLGYIETDRIDPKQIDPNAVIYSANSAPYGEQYPSYLPKSMATMVGTMNTEDSSKTFVTGDHVVYGKFPEGAEASKDINIYYDDDTTIDTDNDYYEDQFEYYDDDYDYDNYGNYDYLESESRSGDSNFESNEDDLKELKALIADDNATSETKMSFLQLLQNLQNES